LSDKSADLRQGRSRPTLSRALDNHSMAGLTASLAYSQPLAPWRRLI
jgi:hypothetical protein